MRPSLSPALVCLACAWAAVLAADRVFADRLFGTNADGVLHAGALFAVLAVSLLVAAALLPRVRPLLAMAGAGLALGFAAGSLAACATVGQASAITGEPVASCTFLVQTDPARTASGRWRFEATCLGTDGAGLGRVWVDASADAVEKVGIPAMGAVLSVHGTWRTLADDAFARSLLARGVCGRLRATSWDEVGAQGGPIGVVRAWRRDLLAVEDPYANPERALTAGVACGMQAAMNGFDVRRDFSDLGLAHLVAVSGSHLAVVAGLLAGACAAARMRPRLRYAVQLTALAVYVVLTGIQGSAVRAFAMVACADAARVAGRRGHTVSSVGIAALVLLLAQPAYAATIGFALSVLSVLGIAVFAGLAGEWVRALLPARTPRAAVDALALTLVSQFFTMPVTVSAFNTVPLLAPLANVVVGPLVSALLVVALVCVPAAALLDGPLSAVSGALLAPCDLLARVCCMIAAALAGVPGACAVVDQEALSLACILVVASVALYALWPAPSRRRWAVLAGTCAAVCLMCWASWRFLAPARIVVLDVGQGDAILVQDGPHALLVDTGPDDAVALALARNHVVHLDAVLLTHTDLDHVGGLAHLAGRVGVDEVVVAQGAAGHIARSEHDLADSVAHAVGSRPEELLTCGALVEVSQGDMLDVGGFDLVVLLPAGTVAGNENEDSIVLLATYEGPRGALAAVLTGDAEVPQVGPAAASGAIGDVDLYKAGHHGSKKSIDAAIMEATTPELVVASAGAGNSYGHPSQECIEVAQGAGATFLCTLDHGDVDVRPGERGAQVRTQR